jgi:hypothetical protein
MISGFAEVILRTFLSPISADKAAAFPPIGPMQRQKARPQAAPFEFYSAIFFH